MSVARAERCTCTAEVLVVEDCPSQAGAARAMAAALAAAGLPSVSVHTIVVTSPEQAAEAGFAGSPSFHLNGDDLFASSSAGGGAPLAPASLSCRLYATAHGLAGLPEHDALVAAVAASAGRWRAFWWSPAVSGQGHAAGLCRVAPVAGGARDGREEVVAPADQAPNCDAARAAGAAPLHRGQPGYRPALDGDHDGLACE